MKTHLVQSYSARTGEFNEKLWDEGLPDLNNDWRHTIEPRDPWEAPGIFNYRNRLESFDFPADMRGLTVLDLGSPSVLFPFEFEKQEARVISVEVPSLDSQDRIPRQSRQMTGSLDGERE